MALNIPKVKLNSGYEIPSFGLGTWKSKPGEVENAVKNAIDVGYRHIDGAMVYENEKEVGSAIQAKIAEGVVKREDLFLTSKLWDTFHRPDLVIPALKKTLADLGTDYIDMYLIHWPMGIKECDVSNITLFPWTDEGNTKWIYSDVDYVDTWKEMEKAVELGLARSIGVSNFNSKQIDRVLAIAKIPPATNQIEIHPYLTNEKIVNFCRGKGIEITAYSPLGSADRPWATPDDPKLLEDPKLIELGKKYNKTAAQLVLRWSIQRQLIAIPKTVNKNRLLENADIFDFELTEEDMKYVNTFNRPDGRGCGETICNDHPHYPFNFQE
jgi:aldehyde reductase